MTATCSAMLPLGTRAPAFNLLDTRTGQQISLEKLPNSAALVIMFICNHCPYVLHIQEKVVEIANEYQKKNVQFIAISSNDAKTYPQDGPDRMREHAQKYHFPFPYLYDESQAVAKAYQAACTPDFYVFDTDRACIYRGRFDSSTPGNSYPVTGDALRLALDNLLAGIPTPTNQQPSIGCNIKWRKQ